MPRDGNRHAVEPRRELRHEGEGRAPGDALREVPGFEPGAVHDDALGGGRDDDAKGERRIDRGVFERSRKFDRLTAHCGNAIRRGLHVGIESVDRSDRTEYECGRHERAERTAYSEENSQVSGKRRLAAGHGDFPFVKDSVVRAQRMERRQRTGRTRSGRPKRAKSRSVLDRPLDCREGGGVGRRSLLSTLPHLG